MLKISELPHDCHMEQISSVLGIFKEIDCLYIIFLQSLKYCFMSVIILNTKKLNSSPPKYCFTTGPMIL